MEDVILQVNHLSKSFGSHEVLRDIDFTVAKGDVTSIIGASGSGKARCFGASTCWKRPPPARSVTTARTWLGGASTRRPTAPMWVWCFSASICSTI